MAGWDLRIRCPRCKASLQALECPFCGLVMRTGRGIVYALPPDRAMYFAKFIRDYERIRAAEGRGSDSDEFYLNLPFKDISGANREHWKIRARTFAHLMSNVLVDGRSGGRILDLGAGNGWLSYRLLLAGYRPVAVDLLTNANDGLGAAEHFEKQVPGLFPRFQAELGCLPFQEDQFDAAIFNASFHYSEDYQRSLGEALRCVKPGGLVVIADSPWYSRDECGQAMLAERREVFLNKYGTASDSIRCLEYLTNHRLRTLSEQFSIEWQILYPHYGWGWALRPGIAKLRGRREPSRFRIYLAKKR
ncbi:MAG: class I SAM-dependent methyltransferase [Acidobacteria bacterium]|nr:class I SAM-dependent methyltransferase [Acidobacteriota bacterium]